MPIVTLDDDFVTNHLVVPDGKTKVEYVSHERTGLYILVSAASPGVGTWFVRFKNAEGKTVHYKLGRSTEMNLEAARQKTREIKAQLVLGQDPHAEKAQRRKLPTLNDFVANEYTSLIKSRKRTWAKDLERYRNHIKPVLGDKKLDAITRARVQALHTAIRDKGLSGASADHVLKVIRQILQLGVDYQYLDKNAAKGIKQYNPDNRREGYLSPAELQRLIHVLNTDDNRTVCQICLFLLNTGARMSEALNAEWRHINKAERVWVIPAETSKNKRIRSIPLGGTALSVLEQVTSEGRSAYVFPNEKTGRPYVSIHKTWDRLRKKAGLPSTRLHDLRHTWASLLVNAGRTLLEVKDILGHSDYKVTTRYAHLSTATLQEAANSASDLLTKVLQQK